MKKRIKKLPVFQLLIMIMLLSVSCTSERTEDNTQSGIQTDESTDKSQQDASTELVPTASASEDNTKVEQEETDPRFKTDAWIEMLGTMIPANDEEDYFMGSKWGDPIDMVKEKMGGEPKSMRGDSQMLYTYPMLDYEAYIYEGFLETGFAYANIVIPEKTSDTQARILIAMNKAASQLYGEAIDNVNRRIIYETEQAHIEIRKTKEDIEIYVDKLSYVDNPNRDGFKGVSYTVE